MTPAAVARSPQRMTPEQQTQAEARKLLLGLSLVQGVLEAQLTAAVVELIFWQALIQREGVKDGSNWYVYCNNDPLGQVDVTGLSASDIQKTVDFGSMVAGAANTAVDFLTWGENSKANEAYASGNIGLGLLHTALGVGAGVFTLATAGTAGVESLSARAATQTVKAAAETVANPIPKTLARVVPGEGPFPTLGAPGSKDVFVTAADDIAGLNASQLAKRLAIDPSDAFAVIQFPSKGQTLASPIDRIFPQFVGGGRTAGGAREFVIPNQSVPAGSTVGVVK